MILQGQGVLQQKRFFNIFVVNMPACKLCAHYVHSTLGLADVKFHIFLLTQSTLADLSERLLMANALCIHTV